MIPALIVPILARPELLRAMIESIDYPVEKIVVIDNGGVVPADIEAIHLPHNIGVAASWNLGIKVTPRAPWWLIVNSDLTFGPGDLERLANTVSPRPALYKMLGLAAFAINQATLEAIGLFDESFHPAYNEDIDYQRRADLAGVPHIEVGFSGTHVGSATIFADLIYRRQNAITHPANDRYYERKWGGTKQGGERFATPFNNGFDLTYAPVDYRRIRDQAWRRREP